MSQRLRSLSVSCPRRERQHVDKVPASHIRELLRAYSRLGLGYNVATDNFENLIESGIIDPAKVVRVALQQAASVAGTMLTSSCLMVEEEPKNR